MKYRTTFNYILIFADVFKFVKSLVYYVFIFGIRVKMFEQLIRKQTQLKNKKFGILHEILFKKKLFSLIFEKTIDLPKK